MKYRKARCAYTQPTAVVLKLCCTLEPLLGNSDAWLLAPDFLIGLGGNLGIGNFQSSTGDAHILQLGNHWPMEMMHLPFVVVNTWPAFKITGFHIKIWTPRSL